MNRELYQRERRLQRNRNLRAALALAIWGGGCYLLYQGWQLRHWLEPPLNDLFGTAIYLITFFYIFAFWPIQSGIERLLGKG